MKIFLGGTCPRDKDDFDYRKVLIPLLEKYKIEYFNPVVDNWTPECIEKENKEKEICNIHLYLIAPNMKGVYSIAEAFGSLIYDREIKNKEGEEKRFTLFGYVKEIKDKSFDAGQIKSLDASLELFYKCGGAGVITLDKEEDINDELVQNLFVR